MTRVLTNFLLFVAPLFSMNSFWNLSDYGSSLGEHDRSRPRLEKKVVLAAIVLVSVMGFGVSDSLSAPY